MDNIFEYAAKNKLRFPYKGMIAAEDLYDLSRTSLDVIYKNLSAKKRNDENEDSLMASTKKTKEQIDLEYSMAIVKHVFDYKTQEEADRMEEKAKKDKKQILLEIKSKKEHEELFNLSSEELQKMIDAI